MASNRPTSHRPNSHSHPALMQRDPKSELDFTDNPAFLFASSSAAASSIAAASSQINFIQPNTMSIDSTVVRPHSSSASVSLFPRAADSDLQKLHNSRTHSHSHAHAQSASIPLIHSSLFSANEQQSFVLPPSNSNSNSNSSHSHSYSLSHSHSHSSQSDNFSNESFPNPSSHSKSNSSISNSLDVYQPAASNQLIASDHSSLSLTPNYQFRCSIEIRCSGDAQKSNKRNFAPICIDSFLINSSSSFQQLLYSAVNIATFDEVKVDHEVNTNQMSEILKCVGNEPMPIFSSSILQAVVTFSAATNSLNSSIRLTFFCPTTVKQCPNIVCPNLFLNLNDRRCCFADETTATNLSRFQLFLVAIGSERFQIPHDRYWLFEEQQRRIHVYVFPSAVPINESTRSLFPPDCFASFTLRIKSKFWVLEILTATEPAKILTLKKLRKEGIKAERSAKKGVAKIQPTQYPAFVSPESAIYSESSDRDRDSVESRKAASSNRSDILSNGINSEFDQRIQFQGDSTAPPSILQSNPSSPSGSIPHHLAAPADHYSSSHQSHDSNSLIHPASHHPQLHLSADSYLSLKSSPNAIPGAIHLIPNQQNQNQQFTAQSNQQLSANSNSVIPPLESPTAAHSPEFSSSYQAANQNHNYSPPIEGVLIVYKDSLSPEYRSLMNLHSDPTNPRDKEFKRGNDGNDDKDEGNDKGNNNRGSGGDNNDFSKPSKKRQFDPSWGYGYSLEPIPSSVALPLFALKFLLGLLSLACICLFLFQSQLFFSFSLSRSANGILPIAAQTQSLAAAAAVYSSDPNSLAANQTSTPVSLSLIQAHDSILSLMAANSLVFQSWYSNRDTQDYLSTLTNSTKFINSTTRAQFLSSVAVNCEESAIIMRSLSDLILFSRGSLALYSQHTPSQYNFINKTKDDFGNLVYTPNIVAICSLYSMSASSARYFRNVICDSSKFAFLMQSFNLSMPGFCSNSPITPVECGNFLINLRNLNLTGLVLSGLYDRVILNNNPNQIQSMESTLKSTILTQTAVAAASDSAYTCVELTSKEIAKNNKENSESNPNSKNYHNSTFALAFNCTGNAKPIVNQNITSNTVNASQPLNTLLQDSDGIDPPSNSFQFDSSSAYTTTHSWTKTTELLNQQTRFLIQKASIVSAIDLIAVSLQQSALRLQFVCHEWNEEYFIDGDSVNGAIGDAVASTVLTAPIDPSATQYPSYYSAVSYDTPTTSSTSQPILADSQLSNVSIQFQFENLILWFIMLIGLSQIWLVIESIIILLPRFIYNRLFKTKIRIDQVSNSSPSTVIPRSLHQPHYHQQHHLASASNSFAVIPSANSGTESVELTSHR